VQQLLVNLLRNANDAMTEDRYDLEVRTALLDNEMVEIRTAVRDYRLKSPAPFRGISIRKRDGIGLGLTICQPIAEVHGGKLQHEPNPGGGTVFRVTLPAIPKNDPDVVFDSQGA
jgi:signal transduction histidine kinase